VISLPAGTRIWIAAGVTDMRRGFHGLSAQVQTVLEQQPLSGHVFIFRGRRGDIVKVLWFDGDGLCLLAKRLERGRTQGEGIDGSRAPKASQSAGLSPCAHTVRSRSHSAVAFGSKRMDPPIRTAGIVPAFAFV
jgi:transposase